MLLGGFFVCVLFDFKPRRFAESFLLIGDPSALPTVKCRISNDLPEFVLFVLKSFFRPVAKSFHGNNAIETRSQ